MITFRGKKGFTLIEMLVVISVIGLLSSVLLTALGPARAKTRDARILQEVNQVRAIAETLFTSDYRALDSVNGVGDIPSIQNPDIQRLANDISNYGGELVIVKERPKPNSYVIYSKMNVTVGTPQMPQIQYFCTDSRGNSGYTTQEPASNATRCNLSNAN